MSGKRYDDQWGKLSPDELARLGIVEVTFARHPVVTFWEGDLPGFAIETADPPAAAPPPDIGPKDEGTWRDRPPLL